MTEPPQPDTRRIVLADGRSLAYAECGAPDGCPVLAFHGLPGSRLQRHPDESIARAAGLRVVHVDRPGFGRSSPQHGRTIADWPRDVAALADRLGLDRFAVAGISGGGPYALACAASLGGRVSRAAIASGVGPPGSMAGRMTVARLGFFLAAHAPWSLRAPVAAVARLAVHDPQRYLDLLAARMAPADRPILARPEVRAMFAQDLREAFRHGVEAFVADLRLVGRPWGFPLDRIACEVALWHGEEDRVVPASAALHLAGMIPGARTHFAPREGHFMVLDRWPEICAWLASTP